MAFAWSEAEALRGRVSRIGCVLSVKAPVVPVVPCRHAVANRGSFSVRRDFHSSTPRYYSQAAPFTKRGENVQLARQPRLKLLHPLSELRGSDTVS